MKRKNSRLRTYAKSAALLGALALCACSAGQNAPSAGAQPAANSSSASSANTQPVLLPASPTAAAEIQAINQQFNASPAYALSPADVQAMTAAGVASNDDAAAIQPLVANQ